MIALTIRHKTTYRYNVAVRLGAHRLMLRPRESRELRLISSELIVMPEAVVTWAHDVFGNSVATATFAGAADHLAVDSVTRLELDATAWPIFEVAASAASYPFPYQPDDRADLGALVVQQYPDPTGRLRVWAEAFVRSRPTDTLSLLKDLSAGIAAWVRYQSRDDEGTQSPIETLDRGQGSCRDFAVLFVEAARGLGFGARIVSGYLYNPEREDGIQHDARLGGSLRAGRRLDHLRSDKSLRRGLQPDPGRGRTRHPPGDARGRQFLGDVQRVAGPVGRRFGKRRSLIDNFPAALRRQWGGGDIGS